MPSLRVDDIALHYEVRGAGAPIVLLHGFTSSAAGNWERRGWIDALVAAGFRVVALDFRSHGRSERVYEPAECTTDRLARDVLALLDHIDVARTDVFGFSMGGGVALHLAMEHPERVRCVVVGGVGDAAFDRLHDPAEIAEIRAAFQADSPATVASPLARAIRRSAESGGNELAALAPFLRRGGWPGGLASIRPVTAPLLVLVAGQDQYMATVDELLRTFPHARVERAPARDHYTVLGDECVRAGVLSFLRECGARGPDRPRAQPNREDDGVERRTSSTR